MWRQFLESLTHDENCFVTLTYNDDCLPSDGALCPEDLSVFIRELRRFASPKRIRYFAVGEYGEEGSRPHYHLSLFGVSAFTIISRRCLSEIIAEIWGKGFTSVYEFNHLTAQYVAGYTVKKIKDVEDGRKFRVPEFARCSNRPGIGAPAMATLGRALLDTYQDWGTGDVPSVLSIGQKRIPIGRYCLSLLRKEVGFTDEYIRTVKGRISWTKSIEMQALLDHLEPNSTIKAQYLKDIEGRLNQIEAAVARQQKRSGK